MFSRKKNADRPRRATRRTLAFQTLETRLALASVGWDGPGLGSARLTYNISNTPSSLTSAETTAAISKAFSIWSSVANISFTPTSQRGLRDSIDISFTRIDGAGRTLAQAYFPKDVNSPRIAGDIQFDSSESWEVGNTKGSRAFDLLWVAVHEIGHSLGLAHINVAGAVLAPYASPNQQFVKLSTADTAAIQRLYAKPVASVTSASLTASTNTDTSNPTDAGDSDDDPIPRSRWRRGGNWHPFGDRLGADTSSNQNPYNATDVNNDSLTSSIDVLQVINFLRRISSNALTSETDDESTGFCDTNGDGEVSPVDVLTVINALNRQSRTDTSTPVIVTNSTSSSVDDEDTNSSSDPESDDDTLDCPEGVAIVGHHRSGHGLRLHRFLGYTAEEIFDRFDENADETLVEDEVPARLWKVFVDRSVDSSGDGAVSLDELTTAITAARTELFNKKDTNTDGFIKEDEVNTRVWTKLSSADTNEDDAISFEEFDAWLEQRASTIPESGHRYHHPHHASDAIFTQIGRIRFR